MKASSKLFRTGSVAITGVAGVAGRCSTAGVEDRRILGATRCYRRWVHLEATDRDLLCGARDGRVGVFIGVWEGARVGVTIGLCMCA